MPRSSRLNSIDLLRGIVMIVMALDHTRDYFHIQAVTGDPLDLQTTSPQLFMTRWITHFCAPTFVFLSGTSAYLQSLRKAPAELSLFLLKRGLWLILFDVTVMTFGITFDIHYSFFILQVIWAIGISMVVLSGAVRLPFRWILFLGILLVAGHNLLDLYEQGSRGRFPVWYGLMHSQSSYSLGSRALLVFYPVLPWFGVMMLGYCFGKFYTADMDKRNRKSIWLGGCLIALFIVLRLADVYGDPLSWSEQKSILYTAFSFINTQKYPPSLLYLCMTIGPALIVLGLLGNARGRLAGIITVYGRVPLFYYVMHFYLLHLLTSILFLIRGHSLDEGMRGMEGVPFRFVQPGEGYGLGIVYLVWILVVIALYPACRWYSGYKARHQHWWLSYL